MKKTKETRKLEIGDVNDREVIRLLSQLCTEIISKPNKKDCVYNISINIPNCSYEKAYRIVDDLFFEYMIHENPKIKDEEIHEFTRKMCHKIVRESNINNHLYDINMTIRNCNYEETFDIIKDLYYDCTVHEHLRKEAV